MERKRDINDDLLLDYIDQSLSEKDRQIVEYEVSRDEALKDRLTYLQNMNDQLATISVSLPPDNFTTQVMTDLSLSIYKIDRKSRLNGLLVMISGIITVMLGAFFISRGLTDFSFSQYFNTSAISNFITIPNEVSVVVDMTIITQALLFVLGVLSLLLLDRIVLKPYFKGRNTQLNF